MPDQSNTLSELDKTLLSMLAAGLGTDAKTLTEGYQKNGLDSVLSALSQKDRQSVQEILSDPQKSEKAQKSAEKAVQNHVIHSLLKKDRK